MENFQEAINEARDLIIGAKNICIIPDENYEPDSVAAALALFYTLKESGKNVNLIINEDLPKNLKFLIPSLDHISYPKNFVISIPERIADVSQIYYEKDGSGLKIHLAISRGLIKKDEIAFYFSEAKPDVIITLGIQDFTAQLSGRLDSFGFLLDSPIINIDYGETENKNFGKINITSQKSLAETAIELAGGIDGLPEGHETATCLMTGIASFTDNFGNQKVTPETFETAGKLMKKGADLKTIKENLFKT